MYLFSEKITNIAKNIFGDIVSEVFIETINGSILNDFYDKVEAESKDDDIVYDQTSIVIIFTNGKQVSFNNSEWGNISTINKLITPFTKDNIEYPDNNQ